MDESELIAGLQAGDERAMAEFIHRYRQALEGVAAGAIAPNLQRRVSPESVAQSVCRTLLRRVQSNPYVLQDADTLWSLLCAIVLTKVRERVRYHRRQRRAVGREVPLDDAMDVADTAAQAPGDVVAFQDAMERALGDLEEEERRIMELRLRAKTQGEIAAAMGCSERTVRRLLHGLEQKLRGRLDA